MGEQPVVIPAFRQADLDSSDWRHVDCLLAAPSLWALQLLASKVGLDAAVEACRDQDALCDEHVAVLRVGSYEPRHLPAHDIVTAALLGCRVRRQLDKLIRGEYKGKTIPLQLVTQAMGIELVDARVAQRAVEGFGRLRAKV